jgi:D-3-phosphoglycerate dehydrogenase
VTGTDPGPHLVCLRGAADVTTLRRGLPRYTVHEITGLDTAAPDLTADADVLVMRSGHRLHAGHLQAWPRLRHVIRAGSGLDGIDTAALTARDIAVHRNPAPAAGAVAQWALAAFLSLARRMPYGHAALIAGQHAKDACLTVAPSRMRIAVWGAGPVGQACAQLLAPHAAEVVYAAWPTVADTLPVRPAEQLPAWADAHLVAVPSTPRTRGMFDGRFLNAVRGRSPLLICVGRLDTLDTAACLQALAGGRLSGLAVDPVDRADLPMWLDRTPPGPLNLIATPHIGAQRRDVREHLDAWVVDTAADILARRGEPSTR